MDVEEFRRFIASLNQLDRLLRRPIGDSAKDEENKTPVQVDESKLDAELTALKKSCETTPADNCILPRRRYLIPVLSNICERILRILEIMVIDAGSHHISVGDRPN